MLSEASGTAVCLKSLGLAVVATLTLAGCSAGTTSGQNAATEPKSGGNQATVVRVIDGDTFEASINSEQKTIRLLNVDTPETKDPTAPVECMGPEASKALEQLLPVGSKVKLELDEEPLDKYGRTLAGVFNSQGDLVNAEIARLGLGVPVLIEPNRKFHPPVVAAFEESRTNKAGLNSDDVSCLPAQQVEQAVEAVRTIVAAPMADADVDLDENASALGAALASIAELKAAANVQDNVLWAAYKEERRTAMVTTIDAAIQTGTAHQAAIDTKKKHLAEAAAAAESARQAQAAEAAAAESARQAQAAEAAAAESARQAQAAEAARLRNVPPVPAPYIPPANVPPVAPAPAPNPYPGYNGPRCYAPGGKSWTPCSKR